MKSWIKKAVLGVTGVAVIVGLTACGHHSPEKKQERALKMVTHKLDLTEQQQPYAENLIKEFAKMKTEMRETRQQQLPKIKELLLSDSVDQASVINLMDNHQEIMEAYKKTISQKVVELHGQLSREQKEELVAMLDKMKQRFNHH